MIHKLRLLLYSAKKTITSYDLLFRICGWYKVHLSLRDNSNDQHNHFHLWLGFSMVSVNWFLKIKDDSYSKSLALINKRRQISNFLHLGTLDDQRHTCFSWPTAMITTTILTSRGCLWSVPTDFKKIKIIYILHLLLNSAKETRGFSYFVFGNCGWSKMHLFPTSNSNDYYNHHNFERAFLWYLWEDF